MLIDQPWARVRAARPLPQPLTPQVLGALSDLEFAELLRDNLVPRNPGQRSEWRRMWSLVTTNDDLAERGFDILEEFLDSTEAVLDEAGTEPAVRKRAEKFLRLAREAWDRIDKRVDEPLGWAGPSGHFEQNARRVIEHLVSAIAEHRRTCETDADVSDADRQLWRVLRRVRLDPRSYGLH